MEDDLKSELDMLKRIVALLLSLGRMADRASARSHAVCTLMMWILRPAEAVVSAYADLPPDIMPAPFARSGDAREDAMRLARRFRMLAHEMMREAEMALHFATCQESKTYEWQASPARCRHTLDRAHSLARWVDRKWLDTS